MQAEKLKATISKTFECIDRGDFDSWKEFYDEDLHYYLSGIPTVMNRDTYMQMLQGMKTIFSNLHHTIHDYIVDEQSDEPIVKIAVRFTAESYHAGTWMNVPATGKHTKADGMICYHFRNGKIIAQWDNLDFLSLMKQVGVIAD